MAPLHGRVLAAAGDISERTWLGASLRAFGLQTALAADCDQLLQAFLGDEFQLVIIDAALPGGAAEACGLIRQQDPQLALVLLSDPGVSAGVADAIPLRRPIDRRRLHALLESRLRRAQPVADSGTADAADGDLDAQLAALRRGYIERLDASALRPMEAAEAAGDWQALRQLAHRVTGTAGCHGLLALATAAARLESALLATATPDPDTLHPMLAAVTAAAADTIAEAAR